MATWDTFAMLILITIAAFVLNLPFGYMRAGTKRLSVAWFLYIHLPIPFIFILRTMAGFDYRVIPIIAIGAVLGQLIGGRLNSARVSENAR